MNKYTNLLLFTSFVFLFGCSKNEKAESKTLKTNMFGSVNTVDSNIYDILNREIVLYDILAGQSLKLVYEDDNYYVYRNIYGSGVP